ncbi:MAG: hypothetical protein ACRC67_39590 [Inquilinus sp.]|uniref:hypothetical protein n=1 Tax=Inquilinus sp. TaxID=1932117 RepID=UPI003F2B88E3
MRCDSVSAGLSRPRGRRPVACSIVSTTLRGICRSSSGWAWISAEWVSPWPIHSQL